MASIAALLVTFDDAAALPRRQVGVKYAKTARQRIILIKNKRTPQYCPVNHIPQKQSETCQQNATVNQRHGGPRAAGLVLHEWPQVRRGPTPSAGRNDERSSQLVGRLRTRTCRR
jgi:hypothetical protein